MRFAMLGTRGVPARYGGFETAIEEIGRRLAAEGHEVVVYCRGADAPPPGTYLGMELVHLPAARKKALETLSHSFLSVVHACTRRRPFDAAIVFNSANSVFLPALRLRGIPTALHVDGLEWKRTKWRGLGRAYYRMAEALGVRWADALIADADGISDYYRDEFGADTDLLTYGAPIQAAPESDRLAELGLATGQYYLVVARFEPENHVLEIVDGYVRSDVQLPLIVVGSAPYSDDYTQQIRERAGDDPRVHLLGAVWDQTQLDQLYANALLYLHGHSVGGTNPSLLRAMGGGAGVAAWDVGFNREVLGRPGRFFDSAQQLAAVLEEAEADPELAREAGDALRRRAAEVYRWTDVAAGYETLLTSLAAGVTRTDGASGRRSRSPGRSSTAVPGRRRSRRALRR